MKVAFLFHTSCITEFKIYNTVISPAGTSPGSTVGLNLKLPLYVGGVDPTITISPSAGASQGFIGCVGEVSVCKKERKRKVTGLGGVVKANKESKYMSSE